MVSINEVVEGESAQNTMEPVKDVVLADSIDDDDDFEVLNNY